MSDEDTVELKRLRLELHQHGSDLLLVGDEFAEGGRYVQMEVRHVSSVGWTWLDWAQAYDALTCEWRNRYATAAPTQDEAGEG